MRGDTGSWMLSIFDCSWLTMLLEVSSATSIHLVVCLLSPTRICKMEDTHLLRLLNPLVVCPRMPEVVPRSSA